jgi:hypothetical protein
MRTTFSAHVMLLDLIILIIFGKMYKLRRSLIYSFLQPLVTSSQLGSNILLNTLFLNTLNLCSSLNMRDQDSNPNKTKVLC